ncbi:tetratricopeptide repeat (TPR)-like superfamily protein [Actinidia rufa]|uniref:Tetratricopeptide repeat (TPR)-like superfamily protein n=1 Tax=Actinidia rufa TaxID=165716 RepID=A0A7J0FBV2_9ERIC|nr:tetratricopeptide repeat (TPR)-like superfamily protein [Actinidia rufa]
MVLVRAPRAPRDLTESGLELVGCESKTVRDDVTGDYVFMYHDMVPLLWSSLTKMYAHARNEARIFELYREIHQVSQASLSLSVVDYFAYLQSRWEEVAQYEPLSEFTTEGGIAALRLDRQHTYQFLMGLKSEFEAFRTQIVNTTPMSSIFEAFAMLDGDERYHRLLQLPPPPVTESIIPDQMALAASGSRFSGGRSSSGRAPCSFCGGVTHGRDRCCKLHPELRETFKRNKEKSKASPRTAAISETCYGSLVAPTAPDLHQFQTQFQNQMEQLQLQFQTQLGSLMQQSPRPNPSPSTATLASGIPTALHVRSSNPSWVLDSGADDHMTGELSLFTSHLSSIDQFVRITDGSAVHVRSKGEICLYSQLTLFSVLYVPDFAYNLLSDQNSKKIFGRGYEWNGLYYFGDPPDSLPSMSLQASGLSDSYRTFISHVSSTPIPRSVSEALRDPNWVTAMQRSAIFQTLNTSSLAASLANSTSPLQKREKLYLLAVGYYRSGEYPRSRKLAEQCLEIAPDWRQALTLKKAVEDRITKDGVIGIGITATAVGLIVGGIAAALARKN